MPEGKNRIHLEVDVLFIGTGAAGLRAAIKVRRYGAEEKSKLSKSGV